MTLMLSSAFKAVALLAVMLITIDGTSVTLRHREMSTVGRQEWIEHNIVTEWIPKQTALIVVDMWNEHWCRSATSRVGELAVIMNETLSAARKLGFNIIFAPSDCTKYYENNPARKYVVGLPNVTVPTSNNKTFPVMPLGTQTNEGCDTNSKQVNTFSA
jgi:hypothetical protein